MRRQYAAYILELMETAEKTCAGPTVLFEHQLDFSKYVEDGAVKVQRVFAVPVECMRRVYKNDAASFWYPLSSRVSFQKQSPG